VTNAVSRCDCRDCAASGIHSDLPELAAHIALAADQTMFAHLLPLQEGLRVQLMRPLADGGWFQPGKGAVNVLGEQAGVPVQASRDLQGKSSDAIRARCLPALAHAEESGGMAVAAS
jgi:hypothetical protein